MLDVNMTDSTDPKYDDAPETLALSNAFSYAFREHAGITRKGTSIPYISHPMAVAGLVMEAGGTEAEVIAALLHDVIEDQPSPADRRRVTDEIRSIFGDDVLGIVEGCSDTLADSPVGPDGSKPDWDTRKATYLEHLKLATASVRLVSASDKLHNARAILADYRAIGDALWSRFSRGKEKQLWYYRSLVRAYQDTATVPRLVEELDRVVTEIERLAGQS